MINNEMRLNGLNTVPDTTKSLTVSEIQKNINNNKQGRESVSAGGVTND
ncbi:MAG: hypothetical protein KAS53_03645 [Candidatus Cloacimonetes bacterium]|nr:hypothetical protein [Candidatus Cloacimonadota bacterium]